MNTIYDTEPPRLSAKQIETEATNILKKYMPDILEFPQPLPVSLLIEKHLGIDLDCMNLSKNRDILGTTVFSDGFIEVYDENRKNKYPVMVNKGTIIIESDLINSNSTGRARFTMGHEVGHWILHNDSDRAMFRCEDKPRKLVTNDDWFEWQADTFSSALLMPRSTFVKEFLNVRKDVAFTRSGTDRNESNSIIAEALSDIFQVSFAAAMVRMKKLQLV